MVLEASSMNFECLWESAGDRRNLDYLDTNITYKVATVSVKPRTADVDSQSNAETA